MQLQQMQIILYTMPLLTIPSKSVDELVAKNELFEDFKAVQEGNVWCVGKYMYQATDIVGQLITDFHLMLTDGDEKDMTFLTKVSDK